MATLPLLAEPGRYVPCDWDLLADRGGLDYWIEHFHLHCRTLEPLIRDVYAPSDHQFEIFRYAYAKELDRLHKHPERFAPLNILALDRLRDSFLRRFGFDDPYRNVKHKENQAALRIYPRLIEELDGQPDDKRLVELIAGIFAGNIFDLGAMATVKEYHTNGLDFFTTRSKLPPRPWLIDDADPLAEAWSPAGWRYRKVIFLADNAGCDFVLGCLPLIREFACRRDSPLPEAGGGGGELAGRTAGSSSPSPRPSPSGRGGVQVVIAVNSGPSLNDILPDEVEFVLGQASAGDPLLAKALARGSIRVVSSGNTAPLIDLGEVSAELAAEARDADLLILEGMGRSVESNRLARFNVDTAKMALLKDPQVAARLGGELFDICCRFERR